MKLTDYNFKNYIGEEYSLGKGTAGAETITAALKLCDAVKRGKLQLHVMTDIDPLEYLGD